MFGAWKQAWKAQEQERNLNAVTEHKLLQEAINTDSEIVAASTHASKSVARFALEASQCSMDSPNTSPTLSVHTGHFPTVTSNLPSLTEAEGRPAKRRKVDTAAFQPDFGPDISFQVPVSQENISTFLLTCSESNRKCASSTTRLRRCSICLFREELVLPIDEEGG